MADTVFPVIQAQDLLNQITDYWDGTVNLVMRLYTNNYTPVAGSTIANFTETTTGGYLPQTVGTWNEATVVGTHAETTPVNPTVFTADGTSHPDVYGMYITDAGNTYVVAAARFDGAPISGFGLNNGDTLTVTFSYVELYSEF